MSQVPATVTPVSHADLIDALTVAYIASLGHPPLNDTLAVICAQIALETGDMRSCICWNVGNYKRGPGPDWCAFETTEYLGSPPVATKMTCEFSAWPDLPSACAFYVQALYSRWPEAWSAAVDGNPEAFAHGLRVRGYYTAPEALYAAGVRRWFSFYLALLGGSSPPAEPDMSGYGGGVLGLAGLLDGAT